MNRYISVFFLMTFFVFKVCPTHKLIYVIAPPRSLSTVFLRAVHARSDVTVYNEPCEYCYLAKHKPQELAMYSEDLPFRTYEEVKKELLKAREKQHVFAKDTPYCTYECFYDDEAFLTDPDIEFRFLIRNPHASLISFHKVLGDELLSSFDWITEWIVYERQYALFEKIKKLRGQTPLVISSEELTTHPHRVMSHFCNRMGLPFKEAMISWPSLKDIFNPLNWHDYTTLEACNLWHRDAIASTHFLSCVRHYDVDAHGNPTFVELSEADRSTVTEIYNYYMRFYTKMKNQIDEGLPYV